MNEWSNNGCAMSPGYLEKKKTEFKTPYSFHEGEPIYIHRYWETISPEETNNELFTSEFNGLLKEEIKAGRVTVFADDRFVSNLSPVEAAKLVNRIPDGFLLKTDHCFFASRQQMTVRVIGLGLKYKDAGGDKIAWLYYPDLRPVVYRSFSSITDKFANQLFSTKLDMTTLKSTNREMAKVGENEKLTLLLAEIDFETGAWVYLLDKDLQHTKKN
jgi:hypothetical protein